MTKRYNVAGATGTFDGITAGSQVSGTAVFIGGETSKVTNLSALVAIDAETDTITITAKWQVSNDNSTWKNLAYDSANSAATVIATGTAGADAAVEKVYEAPSAVYGFRYARLALVVGVTTGTTSDTYTYGYNYVQQN